MEKEEIDVKSIAQAGQDAFVALESESRSRAIIEQLNAEQA
jgi:hypothetical protein